MRCGEASSIVVNKNTQITGARFLLPENVVRNQGKGEC